MGSASILPRFYLTRSCKQILIQRQNQPWNSCLLIVRPISRFADHTFLFSEQVYALQTLTVSGTLATESARSYLAPWQRPCPGHTMRKQNHLQWNPVYQQIHWVHFLCSVIRLVFKLECLIPSTSGDHSTSLTWHYWCSSSSGLPCAGI